MEFCIGRFFFQHFQNVVQLSSCFHCFWWWVYCCLNYCSPLCNVFFYSVSFKDFSLHLYFSTVWLGCALLWFSSYFSFGCAELVGSINWCLSPTLQSFWLSFNFFCLPNSLFPLLVLFGLPMLDLWTLCNRLLKLYSFFYNHVFFLSLPKLDDFYWYSFKFTNSFAVVSTLLLSPSSEFLILDFAFFISEISIFIFWSCYFSSDIFYLFIHCAYIFPYLTEHCFNNSYNIFVDIDNIWVISGLSSVGCIFPWVRINFPSLYIN